MALLQAREVALQASCRAMSKIASSSRKGLGFRV